jgi:hypothetical protein
MLVFHVSLEIRIKRFNFFSPGKVSTDTTANIANPISPTILVNWYNTNSVILTGLNSKLDPTIVNGICSTNFECRHDYIIRINQITSAATATASNSNQQSRTILGKITFFNYFILFLFN